MQMVLHFTPLGERKATTVTGELVSGTRVPQTIFLLRRSHGGYPEGKCLPDMISRCSVR